MKMLRVFSLRMRRRLRDKKYYFLERLFGIKSHTHSLEERRLESKQAISHAGKMYRRYIWKQIFTT